IAAFGVMQSKRFTIDTKDTAAFCIVTAKNGEKLYYGSFPNQPLLESPVSVQSIIRLAVQQAGPAPVDFRDVATHIASTVGTDRFGIPRVPPEYTPIQPARETLERYASQMFQHIGAFKADPAYLGWHFAWAGLKVITKNKDSISPSVSARIVL